MAKIRFAGLIRGFEVKGEATYSPPFMGSYTEPPEGPELGLVVWDKGADPGLNDEDEAGWAEVEALVWAAVERENALLAEFEAQTEAFYAKAPERDSLDILYDCMDEHTGMDEGPAGLQEE